jgi:hypothetical protein
MDASVPLYYYDNTRFHHHHDREKDKGIYLKRVNTQRPRGWILDDIRKILGNKYDDAIEEMLQYTKTIRFQ